MLPATVAEGDALVLSVDLATAGGAVQTVNGGGVTWKEAVAAGDIEIWYGFDSAGGTPTVNVTAAGTITMANLSEWAGIDHLDSTAHATGSEPSVTAGSLETEGSHELLISAGTIDEATGGAAEITAPFADLDIAGTTLGYVAYRDSGTDPTPSATWADTSTDTWSAAIAAFDLSSTPVPSTIVMGSAAPPTTGAVANGPGVAATSDDLPSTAAAGSGSDQ